MASDRTRELARKYLIRRDSRFERESYMPECFDELMTLLNGVRLDEAKWWERQIESRIQGINFYQHKNFDVANGIERERIAKLAAQPTPEVKK